MNTQNTNTESRQVRRANKRAFRKALKSGKPTTIYAGAYYKDDCSEEGFSMGAGIEDQSTMDAIAKFADEAMKCYHNEVAACIAGTDPEYANVTMDQVVSESMQNMKSAIHNWNVIVYKSTKRKMGNHKMEFAWPDVATDLFYIILGIVYGEAHGVLKSDNFNGMSFQTISK